METPKKPTNQYRYGNKICAYCGRSIQRKAERDGEHVVAEAFFRPNVPRDIVIVASCKECNHGFQSGLNDDEGYTVNILLTNHLAWDHPVARAQLAEGGPFQRGVRGRQGAPDRLARSMVVADVLNDDGKPIGQRRGFPFEAHRVRRVMEKIARGIYFHETGLVMPSDFRARVGLFIGRNGEPKKADFEEWEKYVRDLPNAEVISGQTLGEDVFSYWGAWDPTNQESVWFFRFYGGSHLAAVMFVKPRYELNIPRRRRKQSDTPSPAAPV